MARYWIICATIAGLIGCTAQVNKSSVRASAGAPESTRVDSVHIPYNPAAPRYVVTVEPLAVGTSGSGAPTVSRDSYPNYRGWGWGPWGWRAPGADNPAPGAYTAAPPKMTAVVGNGMQAQLITALSNAGNIAVIDYQHDLANRENPSKLVGPGEVGPFVIKGTVSEFNEVAEADDSRQGGSLGWAGTVLGIAGGLAGSSEAALTGAGISAANPSWENKKMRRTGSVAMDLQIIAPETGRIIGSFVASGKFTSESATSGVSLFGVGGGESAFAASSLGQASRAALNDAVRQINTRLTASGYRPQR
jgi:curli biogenesis system outer membrane secretion channel CsgG